MANPFVHVELGTDDTRKARDFYGKLFDWKFEDSPSPVPGGVYTHIRVGEGTGGGLMKKAMPEAPTMWLPYVLVSNLDATLDKAKALGAKVIVQKVVVPHQGAFAVLADPSGAAIGIWQAVE